MFSRIRIVFLSGRLDHKL